MKGIPIAILFLALACSSCTTLEDRFEKKRTEEYVLFEGWAYVGRILNSGNRISWDGGGSVPVMATPTTLFYGLFENAYTQMDSVEVTSFDAAKELFIEATTYEDLVIIQKNSNRALVFLLVPDSKSARRPHSQASRRSQANELASVIETQRQSVDLFGQIRSSRPIGIATRSGLVFESWWVFPHYLNAHFKVERKEIETHFKATREQATARFQQAMGSLVVAPRSTENRFTLLDAGEIKVDRTNPSKIRKELEERNILVDRIVVLNTLRIFLEEKMDPQGNPSIQTKFTCSVQFYDLERFRAADYRTFDHTVTIPMPELLNGGQDEILAEFENAMSEIAGKLRRYLNDSDKPDS